MLKSKIEAILFLTDKPMRAQAIARIVNEDVQLVRQAILDLIHDYEERASGLEIADDNGYIIQVKDQYASIIDEFVPMEMPVSLIRTLSAIAIKQPVPQSEIIKIRGAGAYDHIKELMTRELVIKKEDGRSPLLSTTKKFQEYFRLSQDAKSLRTQLRKEDRVATKEAEGGEGGNDGVAPNLHPESIEITQAKQLEVLFDSSPDSSLVFRAEDLQGPAPSGVDYRLTDEKHIQKSDKVADEVLASDDHPASDVQKTNAHSDIDAANLDAGVDGAQVEANPGGAKLRANNVKSEKQKDVHSSQVDSAKMESSLDSEKADLYQLDSGKEDPTELHSKKAHPSQLESGQADASRDDDNPEQDAIEE